MANFLGSTAKFKVDKIIYNDDHFAVATGLWDGRRAIACRWHQSELGYPQTYGKPQWMLLPDNVHADIADVQDPANLMLTLRFVPYPADSTEGTPQTE